MSQGDPTAEAWSPRRVVAATLVVAGVAAGFWALYQFRLVVLLFFTALVLATSLRPIVQWLRRHGAPRTPTTVAVHLAALGLLAGFLLLMVPLVVAQGTELLQTIPAQYQEWRAERLQSPNRFVHRFAAGLPDDLDFFARRQGAAEPLGGILEVWSYFTSILWTVFLVGALFLLSIYWTIEEERLTRSMLLMVPLERRESAADLIAQIRDKLASFVLGQSILCVIVGVMSLVAYWLIGLPYALALAFLAGVFEAIPNIGPILATIPAVMLGLTIGPAAVAWVIVAQLLISLVENYLLVPRVMDQSVGVHPVVTLLAITALVAAVGVLGGILAIPVAAVLQVLLNRFVFSAPPAAEDEEEDRDRVGVLKYQAQELLQDLQNRWRETPTDPEGPRRDQIEQRIEAVALDLTKALDWLSDQERRR